MTADIQIEPETVLELMRGHREEGPANGIFYLVGHRPDGAAEFIIVPCIEPLSVTAGLIPLMAQNEGLTIDSVVVCVDTYHYVDTAPPPDEEDLASLFAAGDPRVGEAIVAACVDKDSGGWYVSQSYIEADGVIVWGEVEYLVDEGEEDGRIEAHRRSLTFRLEGLLR